MAGRGTSILWYLVKWLVIPIGLAAIGYFLIGPRIGKADPNDPESAKEQQGSSDNSTLQVNHGSHKEPQVQVDAREVNPRKRTNRLRPKPKEEPKETPTETPTEPNKDPGSVGGTTTPPPSTDPVEPPAGGGGGGGTGDGT